MKLTKSILLETIQSVLNEEIYGAMATVYHGSPASPRKFLKLLKNKEYRSQRGFYGKGLYTVWEMDDQISGGFYGKYLYKMNVKLYGFLIFDEEVCKKVYKKSLTILEQIKLMHNGQQIISKMKKLEKQIPGKYRFEISDYNKPLSVYVKDSELLPGELAQAYDQGGSAQMFNQFFNTEIPGLVFHGKDGATVLIHNISSVIPLSWSYADGSDITQINWMNILDPSKWDQVVAKVDKKELGTDEDREELIKRRRKAGMFPKSEFGDDTDTAVEEYINDLKAFGDI